MKAIKLNKIFVIGSLVYILSYMVSCDRLILYEELNATNDSVWTPDHDVAKWKGITWGGSWQKWGGPGSAGPYHAEGVASDISDISDLGADWVRLAFVVGEDIDSTIDPKIQAAIAAKSNILLRYTKGAPARSYGTEPEEALNEQFLRSVVNRYKDVVKYWEIGNEPNLEQYWDLGGRVGQGSSDPNTPYNVGVRNYVLHLQRSYQAIKQEDPSAVVVLAGLSDWEFLPFLERLKAEGAYNFVDELNFHPYASTVAGVLQKLAQYKSNVQSWPAPHSGKPIWITEVGVHTQSGWSTPGYVLDEQAKADFLSQVMYALVADLDHVRPIFWYNLHETSCANGYGLTNKCLSGNVFTQQYLPAYYAFKNLSYDHPLPEDTIRSVPFIETFESFMPGTSPHFWRIHADLQTTAGVDTINGLPNKLLAFTDNNASGIVSARIVYDEQVDTSVMLSFRYNENNTNAFSRFKVLSGDVAPIELATSWLSPANQLYCMIDATTAKQAITPVMTDTWYEIQIQINIPGQVFDVLVNGQLKLANQPFRFAVSGVDGFEVQTGRSKPSNGVFPTKLYIDDVAVQ